MGWTHITSDVITWASYTAIPLVLALFIKRRRTSFPRVTWLFVAFILACGVTHLIEAVIFWLPLYRLAGLSKAITAGVSLATVVALARTLPVAREASELEAIAARLVAENRQRRVAEARSRHLAVLVERSSDVIIGVDREGCVRSWNRAAERILGSAPAEALGRPLRELAAAESREALEALLSVREGWPIHDEKGWPIHDEKGCEGRPEEDLTVEPKTLLFEGPDGRAVELELVLVPVMTESSTPFDAAVVGRDVTERNQARRDVEAANRLLERVNRELEARVEERSASRKERAARARDPRA